LKRGDVVRRRRRRVRPCILFNIGKAQHVNWKSASSFNAPTGAAGPLCTLAFRRQSSAQVLMRSEHAETRFQSHRDAL
jgi:hypothetical protein